MVKKKLDKLPELFKKALPLTKKLQSHGFEVYFVGGSLRDWLLNEPINDLDLATNALPLEVKSLFPHSFDTGIQHGTVTVVLHHENYEITTFRTDGDYLDHRHPNSVKFVRNLEEDLKRRDFTINALAMSPQGEISDYYGGLADLNNKIIRCVLNPFERFNEDALRIFRAIRFVSQLNFSLDPITKKALIKKVPLLANISIERIHHEFIKMMKGVAWQKSFKLIYQAKIDQYMPSIQPSFKTQILENRFSKIVFHDEAEIWSFLFILNVFPINQISKVLNQWKSSNSLIKNVQEICNFYQNYETGLRDYQLFYGLKLSNIKIGTFLLNKINNCKLGESFLDGYNNLPIHQISDLAISGQDLIQFANFQPGKELGKMLKLFENKVLKREINNNKQDLIAYARSQK
ncbi:MAG: CCA tRNA nucleotidyltransferase [Bombilactobacillus mellifer]|nr:CCA tRNA nucleotidyltransferase [Bombilactobacillus mellifer]